MALCWRVLLLWQSFLLHPGVPGEERSQPLKSSLKLSLAKTSPLCGWSPQRFIILVLLFCFFIHQDVSLLKGDSPCLPHANSKKKPSANSVVQSHGLTQLVRDWSGAQAHLELPFQQQTQQLGHACRCAARNSSDNPLLPLGSLILNSSSPNSKFKSLFLLHLSWWYLRMSWEELIVFCLHLSQGHMFFKGIF